MAKIEMSRTANLTFYITESLRGQTIQYSYKQYVDRLTKQKPTYDILTHSKDGIKKVNVKNLLVLDFDGKDIDKFTTLMNCLNNIPEIIKYSCTGYIKPILLDEVSNFYADGQLVYFDIKDNVDDVFSCHIVFNVAVSTDEYIGLKQDIQKYDIFGLNDMVDSSTFTYTRKMRHVLCDKDDKDRHLNLETLNSWLELYELGIDDFIEMTSPQIIKDDTIEYSDFLEMLDVIPDFDIPEPVKNNATEVSNKKITKQQPQNTRASILYYLDGLELSEDNEISNFELGQKLYGIGHSVLSVEELRDEIELLPYYKANPNEIDVLLGYIKPCQDLTNIAPLYKLANIIKDEGANKAINEYIYKYSSISYCAVKPSIYTNIIGISREKKEEKRIEHIRQNVCFVESEGEFFIKVDEYKLRKINVKDMKQLYHARAETIDSLINNYTCRIKDLQQFTVFKAQSIYLTDMDIYMDLAMRQLQIFRSCFISDNEFNIVMNLHQQKLLHPDRMPNMGIIQYGPRNSCKTRISESLNCIIKYHTMNYKDLLSQFTEYVGNDIVCIEELPKSTKDTNEVINKLKAITKTDSVKFEKKGQSAITIKPTYLMIINTNYRSLGGMFDKAVDLEPLLKRFRLIQRQPIDNGADNGPMSQWLIENIKDAEFKDKLGIQYAYAEIIKRGNYPYSYENTQLENEQLEKAQGETNIYKCLTKSEIEDNITTHHYSYGTRYRLNIRELTRLLNTKNRDIMDQKLTISDVRNILLDNNLIRIDGRNTEIKDKDKFMIFFMGEENYELEEYFN